MWLYLIQGIGFGFAGVALLMLAAMVVDRVFGLADPYLLKRPFWVITPLMFLGFALQFISAGLLAEIQIRTWHESKNKPIYIIREQRRGRRPRSCRRRP